MNKRNQSIDEVKGVAILLVMLGHCLVWNNLSQTDGIFYDFIKAVQMPLFMAVSGYLAAMTHKPGSFYQTLRLLSKRAVAYLLPFFVWPMITHPAHPVREMVGILFELDKGLWFLMTLFICMTIVTLLVWEIDAITKNQKTELDFKESLMFFLQILMVYVIIFIFSRAHVRFLSPSLTLTYLPFYAAGYGIKACSFVKKLWEDLGKVTVGIYGVAMVAFLAMIVCFDLQRLEGMKDLLVQMLAGFLGTFVIFYGICGIKKDKKSFPFLARIGTVTLELYCIQYGMHGPFVTIKSLGEQKGNLYSLTGLATVLVTFVVMCIISIIIILIVKKIPILDAILFGHIKSLKQKHQS